jgi:hypothetical protein
MALVPGRTTNLAVATVPLWKTMASSGGCLWKGPLKPIATSLMVAIWCCVVAYGEEQGFSTSIEQSLSASSSDWAPGIPQAIAADVLGLQDELNITFTEQQKKDLLAGLSQPNWLPEITTRTHPLLAQRDRAWIKDRLRRYLTHGRADSARREESLQALQKAVLYAKAQLTKQFPQDAKLIDDAARHCLQGIQTQAANPLRVDYATNAEPELVTESTALADRHIGSLDLSAVKEPEERMVSFYVVMARTTRRLAHANSMALPPSDEYVALNARIDTMSSELAEWRASARTREQAGREAELYAQAILAEDPVRQAVDDRLGELTARSALSTPDSVQPDALATSANADDDEIQSSGQTQRDGPGGKGARPAEKSGRMGWGAGAAVAFAAAILVCTAVLLLRRRGSPS